MHNHCSSFFHLLLLLLFICISTTQAFNFFPAKSPNTLIGGAGTGGVAKLKADLISKADEVSRGLDESPEQRQAIDTLIKTLEKKNPTKVPTASPLITSRWRLIYTTSESILGKTRPAVFRPIGPIYQYINLEKGTARNEETIRPIPFLPAISEAIDATITPVSKERVDVMFQRLMIGPLSVKFQSGNYLDTTFLDQEMRISRGGRGNVFVLLRDDPK